MEKHPIESVMSATLENMRDMVDVNTVIGDAVVTQDGSTVIPVSRVSFGFVSGGGETNCKPKSADAVSGRAAFEKPGRRPCAVSA